MGEQGLGRGHTRFTQVGAGGAAAAWTNRGCAPAGTRARAAFLREPASPPLPWLPGGLEGEGPFLPYTRSPRDRFGGDSMSIRWGVGMWVRARGWPRVGDSRVLAACVQGVSGDRPSPEAGGGRGMEQDGGTVPQGHPSWEPKAQLCQAWGPLPPPGVMPAPLLI